ncbi:UDP-N-acetylmuramate dehydrogenase [Collinsella sp. zg1085]|uniref:UDP-N-acetylmuramate dehydrogenase n=1 Tax=Collinsella sp. zg1085 TaxID=2844380 RepID=UPI001C0BD415|nr:UDP-N-acetylmuramate dehydrogenase [Collinsella sp. zg1085]QWT18045.1 UDP-N-acetylmuramate dehydrogenase [Collinsella sp. zg1085]
MGLFNAAYSLSGQIDTEVAEDERLARHTSYRIGGPARLFVTCHSYHALRRTVDVLTREEVLWVVLGKGSNLLVSDEGYEGAVITLGREFCRFTLSEDGVTLTAGAGAMLARLVNEALTRGLSGLEYAIGIPGTVGGGLSMNAGTRTDWIGTQVAHLVSYKPGMGLKHYQRDDIIWGYRACNLAHDEIILEAAFELEQAPKQDIRERIERHLSKRRRSQPLGLASCGSVFKNPSDLDVGSMIEACGLQGFSIGGAEVSPMHANFIVNKGTARAQDVLEVMRHIMEQVKERYGIELQPEVKFLGF